MRQSLESGRVSPRLFKLGRKAADPRAQFPQLGNAILGQGLDHRLISARLAEGLMTALAAGTWLGYSSDLPSGVGADMTAATSPVAIIMGRPVGLGDHAPRGETLDALGVAYETSIVSAHRTPTALRLCEGRSADGFKVIIAGAGGGAHLPA